MKTGFTNNAGRCLVTSTKRNGHEIICVVLGADTKKIRTTDSIKLIEYAFSSYEYINIKEKIEEEFNKWEKENINTFEIVKGKTKIPKLKLGEIEYTKIPINKNNIKDIQIQIICKNTLEAPIQENQKIGQVEVKIKEETITLVDVMLEQKIEKKNIIEYVKQLMKNYDEYLEIGLQI